MAKLSAISTPSLTFDEGSAPSTPASGKVILYAKTDGSLYQKDDEGTETGLAGGGSGPTVDTEDATLGADVTMTSANTFYDGPSASFAAGTWLIAYKVVAYPSSSTGQTQDITAKLWDGSTVWDEVSQAFPANTSSATLALSMAGMAIVTLASTTTVKVSVASVRAGGTIKRNVPDNSPSSNTATRLVGYRVY